MDKGVEMMGIMQKFMSYVFGPDDEQKQTNKYVEQEDNYEYEEDEWLEEEVYAKPQAVKSTNQNVVHLQAVKQTTKMVLVEPRTYEETQEVADHLRQRRPVVINLQRLHQDQGKRVVDFLSGTVYAIGGEIHKIGPNIFLCTPDNIQIQGTISETFQDDIQSRMR